MRGCRDSASPQVLSPCGYAAIGRAAAKPGRAQQGRREPRWRTLRWSARGLLLLDQTVLPKRLRILRCTTPQQVHRAIVSMQVRGAPAIGVAGAFGVVLAVQQAARKRGRSTAGLVRSVERAARYLLGARPTAVNLRWALAAMRRWAQAHARWSPVAFQRGLLQEAQRLYEAERCVCDAMSRRGARLIRRGEGVLTYCNTGRLATVGIGTAFGVILQACRDGKQPRVFAAETRPRLQGARLTTWEFLQSGIRPTLVADNMVGELMRRGWIARVFVGADRIAANGDTANKVGTYTVALAAKHHRVPFYVVASLSTFDLQALSGAAIPIEHRHADELLAIDGRRLAPPGVRVHNPAFDVTPARLITAIITERGVIHAPNRKKIRRLFQR